MAKCIVFGGNGFIGSHLVDALIAKGHEVSVFDRFSDSVVRFESQGVTRIAGDFMNAQDVSKALKGQDLVFHFISTTTPVTAEDNPSLDVDNIRASIMLFEACVEHKIKKVFFASTGGAIYGDSIEDSVDEDHPTLPLSPYAIGKLTIENYLRYFNRKFGLDYAVFRISNPYGTRQAGNRKQGVISIFLHKIMEKEPLPVFGDGSMIRDYIYVGDAVDMIIATVESGSLKHKVYNIGQGTGVSVSQLIECMKQATGASISIEYFEAPKTFVDSIVLNNRRFIEEFQINPKVDLTTGINLIWQEMRK